MTVINNKIIMGSDISANDSEVYGNITLRRFKFEHLEK